MKLRTGTGADRERIAEIAERSLETSYSLNPRTISGAVEEWYGPASFAERLEEDELLILVAEDDGEPVAFSETLVTEGGQGDLLWLHVHPDARGRGIGKELFEHTRDRLQEAGAEYLRGRVLSDNQTGASFYEERGFERVDEEKIEIDGEQYFQYIYLDADSKRIQSVVTDDGDVVYVDLLDEDVGSEAPFKSVFSDPKRESRYGYYCSNCDSLATAMDAMGQIQCTDCGNTRKATRWDASYM